jgi:hypothetical protein
VIDFINRLNKEQLMIEDDIIDLVYFARVSWSDAWGMCHRQRERVATRIAKYKKIESGAPEQL